MDEHMRRATAIDADIKAAQQGHDPTGEAHSEAAGLYLLEEMLGADTVVEAVQMLKRLAQRLEAIRDALGCDPGDEVEAVRGVRAKWLEARSVIADTRGPIESVAKKMGIIPPTPGDTLNPADFGKGEAGVLRLAALLSEAPEGAVVDCGGDEYRKGSDAWVRDESPFGLTSWGMAERAPLTVVAWLGGAS